MYLTDLSSLKMPQRLGALSAEKQLHGSLSHAPTRDAPSEPSPRSFLLMLESELQPPMPAVTIDCGRSPLCGQSILVLQGRLGCRLLRMPAPSATTANHLRQYTRQEHLGAQKKRSTTDLPGPGAAVDCPSHLLDITLRHRLTACFSCLCFRRAVA